MLDPALVQDDVHRVPWTRGGPADGLGRARRPALASSRRGHDDGMSGLRVREGLVQIRARIRVPEADGLVV